MRKAIALAPLILLLDCISIHPKIELPRRGTPAPAPAPAPAATSVTGEDERLNAVLWMQTAAEYRASALQAFQVAQRMLDRALLDPTWTAAEEQTGAFTGLPPAVIVDIDETVLDNSPFEARQIRAKQSYSEEAWKEWVLEARAEPIPGALTFATDATARGVTIFYVTGRMVDLENATRANLARHGFPLSPNVDTVLTRNERPEWGSDKAARRREIASRYRILLMLGDDFGDFTSASRGTIEERAAAVDRAASRWGTRWIVLPNAMYGSWERAITGSEPNLSEEEKQRRKLQRLNSAQ